MRFLGGLTSLISVFVALPSIAEEKGSFTVRPGHYVYGATSILVEPTAIPNILRFKVRSTKPEGWFRKLVYGRVLSLLPFEVLRPISEGESAVEFYFSELFAVPFFFRGDLMPGAAPISDTLEFGFQGHVGEFNERRHQKVAWWARRENFLSFVTAYSSDISAGIAGGIDPVMDRFFWPTKRDQLDNHSRWLRSGSRSGRGSSDRIRFRSGGITKPQSRVMTISVDRDTRKLNAFAYDHAFHTLVDKVRRPRWTFIKRGRAIRCQTMLDITGTGVSHDRW